MALYIGGLSASCTKPLLSEKLAPYGVTKINLRKRMGNTFAQVVMGDYESAERCILEMNGIEWLGEVVRVEMSKDQPESLQTNKAAKSEMYEQRREYLEAHPKPIREAPYVYVPHIPGEFDEPWREEEDQRRKIIERKKLKKRAREKELKKTPRKRKKKAKKGKGKKKQKQQQEAAAQALAAQQSKKAKTATTKPASATTTAPASTSSQPVVLKATSWDKVLGHKWEDAPTSTFSLSAVFGGGGGGGDAAVDPFSLGGNITNAVEEHRAPRVKHTATAEKQKQKQQQKAEVADNTPAVTLTSNRKQRNNGAAPSFKRDQSLNEIEEHWKHQKGFLARDFKKQKKRATKQ